MIIHCILLFGDAPPHQEDLPACVQAASDFHKQQRGIVSTVRCRGGVCLSESELIAQAGGSEAFLASDTTIEGSNFCCFEIRDGVRLNHPFQEFE